MYPVSAELAGNMTRTKSSRALDHIYSVLCLPPSASHLGLLLPEEVSLQQHLQVTFFSSFKSWNSTQWSSQVAEKKNGASLILFCWQKSKNFEIIIPIAENQIILPQHIAFPFYKTPLMLHSSQLVSVAPLSLGV